MISEPCGRYVAAWHVAVSWPLFDMFFARLCNILTHSALQNGPNWLLKRPILQCEMGRFAVRNGPFRKSVLPGPVCGPVRSTLRCAVRGVAHEAINNAEKHSKNGRKQTKRQ